MPEAKSERINVRLSPDAHEMLRAAASLQQQDLTSFVLGAAMERARAVLAEDRILRLTPHEVNQLEKALDSEPEVVPQLRAFLQRFSDARSEQAEADSRLALAARSCPARTGRARPAWEARGSPLSGRTNRTCVMGVLLDGVAGDPPAILWATVQLDAPVKAEFPARALGTFFAEIDTAAGTLNVRPVRSTGAKTDIGSSPCPQLNRALHWLLEYSDRRAGPVRQSCSVPSHDVDNPTGKISLDHILRRPRSAETPSTAM